MTSHPTDPARTASARPVSPAGRLFDELDLLVELARAFGALPERLVVVTVEAQEVGVGAGLSEPVEAALDEAVAVALDALDVQDLGPRSGRPRPLPRTTRA